MNFCVPCQRHLNGALTCPGCGASAQDETAVMPVVPDGGSVPPSLKLTPLTDASADPGTSTVSIPRQERGALPQDVPTSLASSDGRPVLHGSERGDRGKGRRPAILQAALLAIVVPFLIAATVFAVASLNTDKAPHLGTFPSVAGYATTTSSTSTITVRKSEGEEVAVSSEPVRESPSGSVNVSPPSASPSPTDLAPSTPTAPVGLPASAAKPPVGSLVGSSSQCLAGGGPAPQAGGTALVFVACSGSPEQAWSVVNGSLQLLDKCLDVEGAATEDGSRVQLFGCNGTSAQLWRITSDGSLVHLSSGRCLNAAGFLLKDCDHSAPQRWTLY
ncbi:SCO2400 family protein [Streptomyces sp. NPDC002547]